MDWSTAIPGSDPGKLSKLPTFKVVSAFGCLSKQRLVETAADLLVLAAVRGAHLHSLYKPLDLAFGRRLTQHMLGKGFEGRLGERLLIDIRDLGARQKYVLVVGLGPYRGFNKESACSLFRTIIDTANEIQAQSVCIPIPPNRLSQGAFSLKSTASVLKCRIEERILRGQLGHLQEVLLVCSPQAEAHLLAGLAVSAPRCQLCTNPCMPSRSDLEST